VPLSRARRGDCFRHGLRRRLKLEVFRLCFGQSLLKSLAVAIHANAAGAKRTWLTWRDHSKGRLSASNRNMIGGSRNRHRSKQKHKCRQEFHGVLK
jgi:hypothetical protein